MDKCDELEAAMNQERFFAPRLVGRRFDQHSLPLEILKDFAVFEEMLLEVAKWQFLASNPDRERIPRGFGNGLELNLSSLEDGSRLDELAELPPGWLDGKGLAQKWQVMWQ